MADTIEIGIQLEQASKGLDSAVDKVIKLEQSYARVAKKMGDNNQATKTTKLYLDQATAAAEKLWKSQQTELNKVDNLVRKLGVDIDARLVDQVEKFAESIQNAGKQFGGMSASISKVERDLKKAAEAQNNFNTKAKESEKIRKDAEKSAPKEPADFTQRVKDFFTKSKGQQGSGRGSGSYQSHTINHLEDFMRVGMAASGSSGHYGAISGMGNLLKSFFLQPTGLQMIETVAAGALIAAGTAVALAEPVARKQKLARDYGQNYGAFGASEATLGQYMDVGAANAASLAARDYTSQQYVGFMQMGSSPDKTLGDQNLDLKSWMAQFGSDINMMMTTLHNTPLGSVIDDKRATNIFGRSKEELEASRDEEKANQAMLAVDPKTAQVYTDLYKDLDLFGQKLEQVATVNLVTFASVIDSTIKYLTHAPDTPAQVPGFANPNPFSEWLWKPFGGQPKDWDDPSFHFMPSKDDLKKFGDRPPGSDDLPKYATGAYNVPDDGTAMLHKDELVMPAKEASAFRDMLKGSTSEGSKDFGKFNQEVMKSADIFVDLNKQMTDFNNKLNLASPGSGGSGGGSFSTGFGGGGDSVPVYHSGGIGDDTSAPGRLTGSGHSGRGSGISHSGLGGGGGSGGDDSGKAYGAAKAGSVAAAIFAGESKGDYSIYNYNGGRGVGHMDFSKMTVGEVMEAQRQGKVFAAGAYQVIPKTLSGAVNSLGLDPNTKFDKATQDKIFSGYLATSKKGRGALEDYIKGKSDNSDAALKAAAQEWASIQYHGHGIYDKDGINHGGISDARFLGAMKNARDLYSKSHNYQGALFGEASEETKAAAASYGPKTRSQSLSEATREMPHRPASSSNHIGDMSQYQHDKVPSITIMNKSGSNVNLQTASLGSVQGNFSS